MLFLIGFIMLCISRAARQLGDKTGLSWRKMNPWDTSWDIEAYSLFIHGVLALYFGDLDVLRLISRDLSVICTCSVSISNCIK